MARLLLALVPLLVTAQQLCNNPGTCTTDAACYTCNDGIRNGGETDIDCGGPCAPCVLVQVELVPLVRAALCRLKATSDNGRPVEGRFEFAPSAANSYDPLEGKYTMDVKYTITTGLTNSDHYYHVHRYGDMWADDGSSVEEHFIGTGSREETGVLGDNNAIQVIDSGTSVGGFTENQARLNEGNSIIGRAMIVHGAPGGDDKSRAAQCVIGKKDEDSTILMADVEPITKAVCTFEPTADGPADGFGVIQFERNERNQVDANYIITGFADGDYALEVHNYGDISSPDPGLTTTGNVFNLQSWNPIPGRTRVGEIGGTGYIAKVVGGYGSGYFVDSVVTLWGRYNIVGRSVVIKHLSSGDYVAQCVIGTLGNAVDGTPYTPPPLGIADVNRRSPLVLAARANLYSSTGTRMGMVDILSLPHIHPTNADQTRLKFLVSGLDPFDSYTLAIREKGPGGFPGAVANMGGIFRGWNATRSGVDQFVGLVGDGMHIIADESGKAHGHMYDRFVALHNYNSVLGRSMVIYKGNVTDNVVVGWGVIGRTRETWTQLIYAAPTSVTAKATLKPTLLGPQTLTGSMDFTQQTGTTGVSASWTLTNLPAGTYNWYVYENGNTFDHVAGMSIGNRFRGMGVTRGNCNPPEVGLLNNGASFTAATGTFTDTRPQLGFTNSIIGRAVAIVDSNGTRIAMGIVEISSEDPSFQPDVAQLTYLPPTCIDRLKNGDEEKTDCGGSCPSCDLDPIIPPPLPEFSGANKGLVLSGGAIAGIVIGGVAAIGLGFLALRCLSAKKMAAST